MGRPPLAVGTFGKIGFLVFGAKRVRARASFRDFDGRRRLVTRYGETRAHAERRLREALRDRSGPAADESTADRRLSSMAAAWLRSMTATWRRTPGGSTTSPLTPTSSPGWAGCGCAR